MFAYVVPFQALKHDKFGRLVQYDTYQCLVARGSELKMEECGSWPHARWKFTMDPVDGYLFRIEQSSGTGSKCLSVSGLASPETGAPLLSARWCHKGDWWNQDHFLQAGE